MGIHESIWIHTNEWINNRKGRQEIFINKMSANKYRRNDRVINHQCFLNLMGESLMRIEYPQSTVHYKWKNNLQWGILIDTT